MAIVSIKYPNKIEKYPIIIDLYWYDVEHKAMKKFNGTRLEYEYKYDETINPPRNRLLPKAITEHSSINKLDKEIVLKWSNDYFNYNHSTAQVVETKEDSVLFKVEDDELDDFLYDLDRNGLRFDVS